MKISRDGKDYYEKITVDTRKGTETSKVTEASSGKDSGDAIYDFKRVSSNSVEKFTLLCVAMAFHKLLFARLFWSFAVFVTDVLRIFRD